MKIFGRGERRGCPVARHGDVGKIKGAIDRRNSRIFHSKLLELSLRRKMGSSNGINRFAIMTVQDAQMRDESQTDETITIATYDAHINGGQFIVSFPVNYDALEPGIPTGQGRVAGSSFLCSLRHPHENHHSTLESDSSGVERADNFEIILRRPKIRRP